LRLTFHGAAGEVTGSCFLVDTHAHIDHSGLIPRLAAQGFGGPVYATHATCWA
jgi:Cft2 family RNA processing exonuclease